VPAAAAQADKRVPPAGIFHGLFSEVQWTVGYVGLILYIFAVVTYRLPIATPAIMLALAGVVFGRERIRMPGFLIVFGAFILWGLFGYTQSAYAPVVWDRLVLLTKLWLIAFAAVNTLRTRGQIRFFLVFFLVCFATHPARGAIFNYFYGYTVFGRALWNHIYGNPNDLAALTLFPLSLGIALLKDIDAWIRRGAIVSVVVLTIVILMTQSRGGFLALALMGILIFQTQRRKLRALVSILVVGGIAAAIAPSGVWDRVGGLSEGTEADSSSRQRWAIWNVAREVSADHRWVGVGLGAYPQAHFEYVVNNQADYAFTGGYRDAHSTYLSVRAEAGWPGLGLFLLMVAIPLVQAFRARKRLRQFPVQSAAITAIVVALIGFMAAGIFATYQQLAFLYLHMALLTVLSRVEPTRAAGAARKRRVRGAVLNPGRPAGFGPDR
jgi:probable O-glycosylation ligase (exosortase A-associated)